MDESVLGIASMVAGYVFSIAAAWAVIRHEVSTLKKVVFRDHGEFNFVTVDQCGCNRKECKDNLCRKIEALARQIEENGRDMKEIQAEVKALTIEVKTISANLKFLNGGKNGDQ